MDAWLDHLDEKERNRAAFIGGAVLFCLEAGLQVSGITSLPLAIGLWGIAALLLLYWLSHFKWAAPLRAWIIVRAKDGRIRFAAILMAAGLLFWGGMEFQNWRSIASNDGTAGQPQLATARLYYNMNNPAPDVVEADNVVTPPMSFEWADDGAMINGVRPDRSNGRC